MSSPGAEPRPSYSHTRERIVRAVPPPLICSLTCGGRECRYEGPEGWSVEQQAIQGLYSSWITDQIVAMSRPSTRLIKEQNITEQFHRFGIRSLVSAQLPWEHAHCGDPLDPQSGFSYKPQDFMDSGISFYNFGLPDFGTVPVPRVLDAVKVIAFALREGKVAVHCHAGLGRTGVLIACYLVFACRVSASDSIRFVRLRRPGSIQTGSQVSLVCDFAMFLSSQWPVFSCISPASPSFTLPQYMTQQRHLLHGLESRSLRHLPKPVAVTCRRLSQLARGRRGWGGPWEELEREAERKLLHQVIVRAVNYPESRKEPPLARENEDGEEVRSRRTRRGLLQSQTSCDNSILHLLLTGETQVQVVSNGLCHLDLVQMTPPGSEVTRSEVTQRTRESNVTNGGDGPGQGQLRAPPHVLCIAEALAELEAPDTETRQHVQSLQKLLNEEGAWATLFTESNPRILSTLLWDWLQQLKEPVLSQDDINLFCDGDWRQTLSKLSRCRGETLCCILRCVCTLPSLPPALEDLVLLRLIAALTQLPPGGPVRPPSLLSHLHSFLCEIRVHGVTFQGQRKRPPRADKYRTEEQGPPRDKARVETPEGLIQNGGGETPEELIQNGGETPE
ncbi:protein tyrosine phosphatase domain-containing protein 1-like isoform X2 [Ascaphus truei]|uniref:protein tyrosine phosphatase domain-containing protein 1-like isoform X2 n=1 Tax=Ascaphus truei TaxID=8439 RepID=UPI003F59F6B3